MMLQFNDSGAWKKGLRFEEDQLRQVQAAACQLAAITGTKMRILQDDGVTVYAYCLKPETGLWDVR